MKIDLIIVLVILAIHWFADFIMQTDEEAQGKSKSWKWLLQHTLKYSGTWVFPIVTLFGITKPNLQAHEYVLVTFYFTAITFLFHTIQDYFTSRINSRLWNNKQVHLFFVSIGFDQLLHYAQLLLTFYFLTR